MSEGSSHPDVWWEGREYNLSHVWRKKCLKCEESIGKKCHRAMSLSIIRRMAAKKKKEIWNVSKSIYQLKKWRRNGGEKHLKENNQRAKASENRRIEKRKEMKKKSGGASRRNLYEGKSIYRKWKIYRIYMKNDRRKAMRKEMRGREGLYHLMYILNLFPQPGNSLYV